MEQDTLTGTRDESAPRAEPDLALASRAEPDLPVAPDAGLNLELRTAFEDKLSAFIRRGLKLGDDVVIAADVDLGAQIGLDSIEAFDAVATLHELMQVSIPDDFNPRAVSTLRRLSEYVLRSFGDEAAQRFISIDLETIDFNRTDDL